MNESHPGTVLERLDRLERENRRLKRLPGAALLGIAALALMGQASAPQVSSNIVRIFEAEKFVLHGPDGQVRAELGVEANGETIFRLFADRKRDRAEAVLAVSAEGLPRLQFTDDSGLPRAVMGHVAIVQTTGEVEQRPASSLVFSDKDGKVIWKVPQ